MPESKIPREFQLQLRNSLETNQVLSEPADCWNYGYDNSRAHHLPDIVVLANNHQDVVNTVKSCYEYQIPLTAHGRASGTCGGAIPVRGGVVISLERMQKIIKLDTENQVLVAEAGVLNSEVQAKAKEKGFFWAPDPTSSPYCSIGGNLACNAAGPRAIKYGTTRENTLGLTVVTGTGDTLKCGVYTTKGVVGYDLTRLFVGSEGTLGIITSANLKLLPLQPEKCTIRLLFNNFTSAAEAVINIMNQSATPCGCEFIDASAIKMINDHANAGLPKNAQAMLLVVLDGQEAQIKSSAELIKAITQTENLLDYQVAFSASEQEALWKTRKSLSQALRSLSKHKINEDVVVPIANMDELLTFIDNLKSKYDFTIVNFGHIGNGNIHVNILADPLDPIQGPKALSCLEELFSKVIGLGGTLSGEHGVGIEKRDFVAKELDELNIKYMQQLKSVFDPKGILNPDKMFPST